MCKLLFSFEFILILWIGIIRLSLGDIFESFSIIFPSCTSSIISLSLSISSGKRLISSSISKQSKENGLDEVLLATFFINSNGTYTYIEKNLIFKYLFYLKYNNRIELI